MAIFYCLETQEESPFIYCDGYLVGERMLEGIPIKVTLRASGSTKLRSELTPSDFDVEWPPNPYLQTLNMGYWTERALEICPELDCGYHNTESLEGPEFDMFDSLEHALTFL